MKPTKYTKDILEQAIAASFTWADVQRKLRGKVTSGGMSGHLKGMAVRLKIDFSHFKGRSWGKGQPSSKKKDPSYFLQAHTSEDRLKPPSGTRLKSAMRESDVPYQCSVPGCSVGGYWNNKPIVLQVDHINGDKFDCRLENLRFLCPNCHTQTPTWGAKNQDRPPPKTYRCTSCGAGITRKSTQCRSCAMKTRMQSGITTHIVNWPDLKTLLEMTSQNSLEAVGRALKCSANSVRNHLKTNGVSRIPSPEKIEAPHGTEYKYRRKACRCIVCVEAHRKRRRVGW